MDSTMDNHVTELNRVLQDLGQMIGELDSLESHTSQSSLKKHDSDDDVMLEELLADCDVLDHDDSKPLIDTNRHMEILQEQGAALSSDEWMTSPPKDSNVSKDVNDNEGAKSADETKEPQSAGGTSVQIFNEDHSCMTVSVGQNMSAVECCHKLVLLNTFKEDPNWAIAEHVTDLGIERVVEDHERILEVYQHWAPNSNNKFLFRKDHKKYDFFINTAEYFPSHLLDDDSSDRAVTEQAERAKQILLQNLFRQCTQVPEIASMLYIKDFSKKSWSKKYLILRGSGLYSSTKGKSRAFKDLQSFVQFDGCALYYLLNSTKIHKSPTPYGFCLVPLKAKELKEIKCFCCEDEKSFLSWMTGIRLAKVSQIPNLDTVTNRLHNSPNSHNKPARPMPAFGTFAISLLQFLDPKVSVCYGCKESLKPEGKVPSPPLDLTIVSRVRRDYIKDGVSKTSPDLSNVYYHLNPNCVSQKHNFFIPSLVQVPPDLIPFLDRGHVKFIFERLNVKVS